MGINSGSKCLLMGLNGVTYQAMLEDVSIGGALIKLSDGAPHGLHVGEMCGLMLCEDSGLRPTKHTGRIVVLDSGCVEISFHHQEHQHKKRKYNSAP